MEDVNSRNIRNKVSGGMMVEVTFVCDVIYENQRVVHAQINVIFDPVGVECYSWDVVYQNKIAFIKNSLLVQIYMVKVA